MNTLSMGNLHRSVIWYGCENKKDYIILPTKIEAVMKNWLEKSVTKGVDGWAEKGCILIEHSQTVVPDSVTFPRNIE